MTTEQVLLITVSVPNPNEKDSLAQYGQGAGKLIAQNVYDNAKVVYIATAPDGKEVEELHRAKTERG